MARTAALLGGALLFVMVLNTGVAWPANPAATKLVQSLQALSAEHHDSSSQSESQGEADHSLQNENLEEEGRVEGF